MIISMKLTITDLLNKNQWSFFLVSEACAVPLISEVICHSLNVNKALRSKVLFRVTWKACIANGFPRVNNTSFVCPKLATVYEVCHIRYKSMGTIMKAVIFVVCNA